MKPLQETLGELSDLATGDDFMADLAASAPPEAAFAAGQLSCTRKAGETRLLSDLHKQWTRFVALDL